MPRTITVYARDLVPGDRCTGSGAVVAQVYRDGLFAHHMDGRPIEPRRAFPRGRVEVWVTYNDHEHPRRCEWGARTTITVERAGL